MTAPAATRLRERARALVLGRGRSTTRRVLLWLAAGLVVLTAAVFVTSFLAFTRAHGAADTVRDRNAPAVLGIVTARTALVEGDRAAVARFKTRVSLVGPGAEFQAQLAVASQSLTRVAQANTVGQDGANDLQLIDGLLVTYTNLIGQAGAHFRQEGDDTLGVVDLWSASRMLHQPESGILAQLDTLLERQRAALDEQVSGGAMTPGAVVTLWVLAGALFTLLVVTSIVFARRFRRRVNPWLVLAAALLVALTWVATRGGAAQEHLEDARSTLYGLVADERARMSAVDEEGQQDLRKLLMRHCVSPGGCGETVARFVEQVGDGDESSGAAADGLATDETRAVTAATAAASANAGLAPLVPALAASIVAAVLLAFRPRLYEYRYRSR